MKKLYLSFVLLSTIFFTGCSNMEFGFEKDSIFYSGGVVYIYLDKDMKSDKKYRVYINGEDSEVSLMPDFKTRFGIKPGDTRIEIVHGRETADIHLNLKASKNYYLRVQKDANAHMQIIQIAKKSISEDVKDTPLYVDENKQKSEETPKSTNVKPKEGETTFSYDPMDGE